jgi:putative transposase
MARLARVIALDIPHHITQRGNRGQKVFFRDADYEAYLMLMSQWCKKFGVEILAYCLMPNYVHLLAIPQKESSLARAIGEAHRRYTVMINLRKKWRGYLWEGRFSSFPVDKEFLLRAVRYIEMAPVREGLTDNPEDYRWSSAVTHINNSNDLLVKSSSIFEKKTNWQKFLYEQERKAFIIDFERHQRTGRPYGDDIFVEKLERLTGRELKLKPAGRPAGKKRR